MQWTASVSFQGCRKKHVSICLLNSKDNRRSYCKTLAPSLALWNALLHVSSHKPRPMPDKQLWLAPGVLVIQRMSSNSLSSKRACRTHSSDDSNNPAGSFELTRPSVPVVEALSTVRYTTVSWSVSCVSNRLGCPIYGGEGCRNSFLYFLLLFFTCRSRNEFTVIYCKVL